MIAHNWEVLFSVSWWMHRHKLLFSMTLLLQRLNTILRMVALLVHRYELSCCSLVVDAVRSTVLLPCTAEIVIAEAQTRQIHQVADADDQNVLLHCCPTNNMHPPPPPVT